MKQEAAKKNYFNMFKKDFSNIFKKVLSNIFEKVIYNFLDKKKEAQIENIAIKINKEKDFYSNNKKNKKEINILTKVFFIVVNSKFETKLKLEFLSILFISILKKVSKEKQDCKIKKNKF